MLQLRCTRKVLKALGMPPGDVAVIRDSDALLGDWYVNLFTADRRKCFIFMNGTTLLSFIVYGVKKGNIGKLPEIFLNSLDHLLTLEGFSIGEINRVFSGYDSYQITKTDSKKILGNMNDLVNLYQHAIWHGGGFTTCDLSAIIRKLNRTPQRNLGWGYSIEVLKDLLRGSQNKPT